jgi:hypothetical protein
MHKTDARMNLTEDELITIEQVAETLRELADGLEANPELELVPAAWWAEQAVRKLDRVWKARKDRRVAQEKAVAAE